MQHRTLRFAAQLATLVFAGWAGCGGNGGSGGEGTSGSSGDTTGDTGAGTDQTPDSCGNNIVDPGESCDDGINDGRYGGCQPGCDAVAPFCGDGVIDAEEICDDGTNDGSYDGCEPGCLALAGFCGDGEVQAPEGCDEQDTNNEDGCNVDCTVSGSVLWQSTWATTEVQSAAFALADDRDVSHGLFGGGLAPRELVRFDSLGTEIGRGTLDTGAAWFSADMYSPSAVLRLAGTDGASGARAEVSAADGQLQGVVTDTTVTGWGAQCVGSDGRFALSGSLVANIGSAQFQDAVVRVLDPSGTQLWETSLPDTGVTDCAFLANDRLALAIFSQQTRINGIAVTDDANGPDGNLVVDDMTRIGTWFRMTATATDDLIVVGEQPGDGGGVPLIRAWTADGQELWDGSLSGNSAQGNWAHISMTGTGNAVADGFMGSTFEVRKYTADTGELLWASTLTDVTVWGSAALNDGRVTFVGLIAPDLDPVIGQLAP